MSFLLKYENNRWKKSIDTLENVDKGSSTLIISKSKNSLILGDIYNLNNIEDVFETNWTKNPLELLKFLGSFSIVKLEKNKLCFASTLGGLEYLFYYQDKEKFILTDNFWNIVSDIKPQFNDLDLEYIKEDILYPSFSRNNTYIKKIKILSPSSYGVFDTETKILEINSYFDYKYQVKEKKIDEAVEELDSILNLSMKYIKEKYGNVKYLVGISGGLDSRIIPHYALKNGLNLESYIFCKKRPHKILLSQDVKNSRKIVEKFKLKHTEITWKNKTLEDKILLDIRNNPVGMPQFMSYEDISKLDFDILLTGGSGFIVGSALPENKDLLKMNNEELRESIKNDLGRIYYSSSVFINRFERVIKYFFNIEYKFKVKDKAWKNKIFNLKDEKIIDKKISDYIFEKKKKGYSNLDIYEDIFCNSLGYKNRKGAFESHIGTQKSVSIYIPFLIKNCLSWKYEFLEERKLLNELIVKKIPEISNVTSQTYDLGPLESRHLKNVKKFLKVLTYIARGNGTYLNMIHFHDKKCYSKFLSDMNNNTEWFYNIFPIQSSIREISKNQILLSEKLWKAKRILDCIENRQYLEFIDNN